MALLAKREAMTASEAMLRSSMITTRRPQFKVCPQHSEEQVLFDAGNRRLMCCRCLAVHQLRRNCDTLDIRMADDYCL